MSSSRETFMDLCLKGETGPQAIDDFVDLWHDGDMLETLQAFIGLDDREYGLWLTRPELFALIVNARKIHQPLEDALASLNPPGAGN